MEPEEEIEQRSTIQHSAKRQKQWQKQGNMMSLKG